MVWFIVLFIVVIYNSYYNVNFRKDGTFHHSSVGNSLFCFNIVGELPQKKKTHIRLAPRKLLPMLQCLFYTFFCKYEIRSRIISKIFHCDVTCGHIDIEFLWVQTFITNLQEPFTASLILIKFFSSFISRTVSSKICNAYIDLESSDQWGDLVSLNFNSSL